MRVNAKVKGEVKIRVKARVMAEGAARSAWRRDEAPLVVGRPAAPVNLFHHQPRPLIGRPLQASLGRGGPGSLCGAAASYTPLSQAPVGTLGLGE